MLELDNELKQKIKHIKENCNRVDNSPNTKEMKYIDKHNNIILVTKEYENSITYNINEYEYDEFGNVLSIINTYVVNNEVSTCDNIIYFEYTFNKNNKISEKKTYNNIYNLTNQMQYFYDNNNCLIKKEEYDSLGSYPSLALSKVHNYHYNFVGDLVLEQICLSSGDVSYYVEYGETERIKNPFNSNYAWIISSISEGCFEITIKENTFTCDMLRDIVESICKNYTNCNWILLALGNMKSELDASALNALFQYYEKNKNIIFNYIY